MSLFSIQGDNLLSLSDEILVHILTFLERGMDKINASQSCSRLHRLTKDKNVTKNLSFRQETSEMILIDK